MVPSRFHISSSLPSSQSLTRKTSFSISNPYLRVHTIKTPPIILSSPLLSPLPPSFPVTPAYPTTSPSSSFPFFSHPLLFPPHPLLAQSSLPSPIPSHPPPISSPPLLSCSHLTPSSLPPPLRHFLPSSSSSPFSLFHSSPLLSSPLPIPPQLPLHAPQPPPSLQTASHKKSLSHPLPSPPPASSLPQTLLSHKNPSILNPTPSPQQKYQSHDTTYPPPLSPLFAPLTPPPISQLSRHILSV